MDDFLFNPLVWLSIFIISFFIPIIIKLFKNNKNDNKWILNRNTIINNSNISINFLVIYFLIFFIFLGIILIYISLTKTDVLFNKIAGCIGSIIVIIFPIIAIKHILKEYIKIKYTDYVIVIDELVDYHFQQDNTSNNYSKWHLYFKDFFTIYNKSIIIKGYANKKYNIGDKFYLVFFKGDTFPYIFPLKRYNLDESEKNKLVTYENLQNFINIKKFELNNNNINENIIDENKIINKQNIIKIFNKEKKKKIIDDSLVCLFILIILIIAIFFKNTLAIILITLLFIFFLLLTLWSIKYSYTIIKNIKTNNFKIKIDIVESLNNKVEFKDSNTIISFRFKSYKKIVFADKNDYQNTTIGDEFYLIFVKGEKEPIKVYRVKDSILDNDVKNMII